MKGRRRIVFQTNICFLLTGAKMKHLIVIYLHVKGFVF